MTRDRLPYLLIPVAALIAVLPLILHGPSCGHDFDFHILNWLEAAAQFRHGNLHPHWAFSPAWNAGEPRFVFYPPLSWTLGALLGLIIPWTWTPIAYTWIALTASGLAMHRLTRAHADPNAALISSILYLANPYMLFTAYERTAYAELLAAAFLPLLFHAILKARPTIPSIAIPLSLLWLTNAPAAVMGTYTLALLALVRLTVHPTTQNPNSDWKNPKSRLQLVLITGAGTLLGLTLAAFYIVPAASQRPLVQIAMVVIPGMRIQDNTLFHHTGISEDAIAHDAVLHTASLIALILLTLTAIALLCANLRTRAIPPVTVITSLHPPSRRLGDEASRLAVAILILALVIAILLTPLSLPIWRHAPELAFLQFPWRLLAILATALSLAAALALDRLQWKVLPCTLVALTLAITLTNAAAPTFRQPCDVEDTVQSRLAAFQSHAGSEPTDEYTPAIADNDSLQTHAPPFWLSPDPDAKPPASQTTGSAATGMTVTTRMPQYLILNLRRYPAWQLTRNGIPIPERSLGEHPRADGLFEISIPEGTSRIRLAYRTGYREHLAETASGAALILLLFLLKRNSALPDNIAP